MQPCRRLDSYDYVALQRFVSKISSGYSHKDEHWLWNAGKLNNGYGTFTYLGKKILAHHFSWYIFKGTVYEMREIHHKCEIKHCVNPNHLEQLRIGEHSHSHAHVHMSYRTYCKRGHLLSETEYIRSDNTRYCRECKSIRNKKRYLSPL